MLSLKLEFNTLTLPITLFHFVVGFRVERELKFYRTRSSERISGFVLEASNATEQRNSSTLLKASAFE
jgi:hypothetical protein